MPSIQLRIDQYATEYSLNSSNHDFATNRLLLCFRLGKIQLIEETLRKTEVRAIGYLKTPLLSLGVIRGLSLSDLRRLLELGCSPKDSDTNGYTPMHLAVWSFYDVFKQPTSPSGQSGHCKIDRSDLIDLFLEFVKDPNEQFELIFTSSNKNGMTPFLLACASGNETLIRKLLSIHDRLGISLPCRFLIDKEGKNVFHHLFISYQTSPTFWKLLVLVKEKLTSCLLRAQDMNGQHPFEYNSSSVPEEASEWIALLPEVTQIEILNKAISRGSSHLVEYFLRCGISANSLRRIPFVSPLSAALHFPYYDQPSSDAPRIAELLLDFGADPTREFYLQCDDLGNAIPFFEAEHRRCLAMRGLKANEDLVEKVRMIRRSGVLIKLTRLCRTAIREHLGSNADESIEKLTCLPQFLKVFLSLKHMSRLLDKF